MASDIADIIEVLALELNKVPIWRRQKTYFLSYIKGVISQALDRGKLQIWAEVL
jgi:hypothetical protein